MRNLKVGKKLIISFGTILILFVISVIVVASSLGGIKAQLEQFYNVPWVTKATAMQLKSDLSQQQKSLFRAVATTDMSIITPALADVESYGQKIQNNLDVLESKVLKENIGLIDDLRNKFDQWNAVKDQALTMANDTSISSNDISQYLQENSLQIISEVEASLDNTIATANQTGERLITNTGNAQSFTTFLLITMCGISVVAGIILCLYITRCITRPLKEIESAADEMAQGRLSVSIQYTSKDELGNLANSMRTMSERIAFYMSKLASAMRQLAGGDLNVERQEAFLGDFGEVQSAIRVLINSLNDTLTQINQSADQVSTGSDQVSSGSQALSQGATEQASSIQQLAATITEISDKIKNSASNAKEASARANSVSGEIADSNRQMQDMIAAMNEISSSSSEIGKIIKTIEDIAFQTNILALNAAVEAARAGVAGKGFAVVADEVRNLASKSAEASKDTAALIESSLRAVENGTKIADETAKSLLSSVDGAKEVMNKIDNISAASKEQAEAITQVTQGVDQISSVVQTNSATAEESAAASEELSGQAQMLRSLVARFKLRNGGNTIGISAPSAPSAPSLPEPVGTYLSNGLSDY